MLLVFNSLNEYFSKVGCPTPSSIYTTREFGRNVNTKPTPDLLGQTLGGLDQVGVRRRAQPVV